MSDATRAVIHFYSTKGEHGCFSNFYRASIFRNRTLHHDPTRSTPRRFVASSKEFLKAAPSAHDYTRWQQQQKQGKPQVSEAKEAIKAGT